MFLVEILGYLLFALKDTSNY